MLIDTLSELAAKRSSTTYDWKIEIKHVNRTHSLNGYPTWILTNKKKKNQITDNLSLYLKLFQRPQYSWFRENSKTNSREPPHAESLQTYK